MGAVDVNAVVKANTAEEAHEKFDKLVEEDQEEYGHGEGYPGAWNGVDGMTILEKVAKTRKQAMKMVEEAGPEKWGPGYGAFFYCFKGKEGSKPRDSMVEKYKKMVAERKQIEEDLEKVKRSAKESFLKDHGKVVAQGTSYGYGWNRGYTEPSEKKKKEAEEANKRLVQCRACKSRIRRLHIRSLKCPVCEQPMVKPGTSKELGLKRKRLALLQKKIKEHPQLFACYMEGVSPS